MFGSTKGTSSDLSVVRKVSLAETKDVPFVERNMYVLKKKLLKIVIKMRYGRRHINYERAIGERKRKKTNQKVKKGEKNFKQHDSLLFVRRC